MLQSDREHAQAGDDAGVQPPDLSVVPGDEDLSHVLATWLALPTHREQRRFLTAHTELLHPPSAALLNELLAQEANNSKEALRLRGALALLEDAQRRGGSAEAIRQTYVDAHGGFALDLPPWLEAVEQQLSELRREGQPHQTAQAYIDLLRDALVQAQHAPDVAPETLATVQHELAVAWQEHAQTDRAQAYETVITLCEAALHTYTLVRYPRQYADIQNTLGRTYQRRVMGSRRENMELAIACHQRALSVFTLHDFPVEYAHSNKYLGQVYWQRSEGERRENLEQAIACYQQALRIFTREAFPEEHARTLHILGVVYAQRSEGERRENLEQAIACYREALHVLTLADHPLEYAHAHNNLGLFYWQRSEGERRENLEQAIACYQQALLVCTLEAFPYEYARLQNNLGAIYFARISGKRSNNVEQAIAYYRAALRVWTLDAFSLQYAKVQNNLGEAYQHRQLGDRRENLEQAIACYQEALRIFTPQTSPDFYALLQQNLGEAYQHRLAGNRQENLARALTSYAGALRYYTRDAFPHEHRLVQLLRAETCAGGGEWTTAHEAYTAAREAENLLVALGAGTLGRDAILREGRDAAIRAGFVLARLERIEEAVVTIERGRARGLAEALEFNAADPSHISDPGRRARYAAARQAFIVAQAALNAPLSSDLDEDAQRRMNLERTANYREAKAAFDAVVAEIRAARDPADFLFAPFDAATLLHVAEYCGPGHALVYLAATPWGGLAVAALAANPRLQTASRFAVLTLPKLTDDLVNALIESRLGDDVDAITGGFDCAQRGNALDLLSHWPGVTLQEKAEALHAACLAAGHTATLDTAAQVITSLPALASLVTQPPGTLSDEQNALLASTLGHIVLREELARCLPQLAEAAMRPLVAWLGERGVNSLTLIPCGPLAAFPLLAVSLPGGRTVNETVPASAAPSGRSLLRTKQSARARRGIYTLGNPYPTRQVLRWGEAEAWTLAALGSQPGQPTGVKLQWEATRDWLLEVLHTGHVVDASCHGVFEARDFLRSRLLLANAEELTLADLLSYQADLRGLRLLILSACQTALLDLHGARDEVHSLAAGMLQAGAEAVLASLWPVDDKATYLLMVRFAQEWFPHMTQESPAAALARAQHWLRTVTNRALHTWEAALLPTSIQGEQSADLQMQEDAALAQEATSPSPMAAVRGRGNRFDALQAQELVQMRAEEQEPDARPYAAPYYWAGFQITDW